MKPPLWTRRGRSLSISLLMVMMLSFGFAMVFQAPPAHAGAGVLHSASVGFTNTNTDNVALTVASSGDLIVVTLQWSYANAAFGCNHVSNHYCSPTIAPNFFQVSSVTDTFGDTFTADAALRPMFVTNASGAYNCAGCYVDEIWSALSTSNGADTIVVTVSQNGGTTLTLNNNINADFETIDAAGAINTLNGVTGGSCFTLVNTCLPAPTTTPTLPVNNGDLYVGGIYIGCAPAAVFTPGGGFTAIGNASPYVGDMMYSTLGTIGLGTITNFPAACSAGAGSWIDEGVDFSGGAVVATTTINTMCLGGCSTGHNSTSNYLLSNYLYYYQSQNVATTGTIDNVTLYVNAVHINAATGSLLILTYSTFNANPPSAGNPLVYIPANSLTVPVFNGTTNFYIHKNPQSLICSSCWYAIAIMATTTKSNSATVTGSGIKVAEAAQPTSTEYDYNAGSSTPPTTFYSATTKTPYDWFYIHMIFPVAIVTTTSTSTTTVGGTATTTSTFTSTATTIDSGFVTNNVNFPLILLLLFLPTGIFFGISKTIGGALVGMLIGSVLLIVLVPTLAWLFTGLVIVIVAIAIMAQRGGIT